MNGNNYTRLVSFFEQAVALRTRLLAEGVTSARVWLNHYLPLKQEAVRDLVPGLDADVLVKMRRDDADRNLNSAMIQIVHHGETPVGMACDLSNSYPFNL